MTLTDRPVAALHEAPDNPRLIDESAVNAVAASIREFGFRIPILATESGEVVCGHVRLRAARQLGLDTVPCLSAADMTPEQVARFRLVENRSHDLGGEWDVDALARMLPEMPDLSGWFDDLELPPLPALPTDVATMPPELPPDAIDGGAGGFTPSEGSEGAPEPSEGAPDPDPVVFLAVRVRRSAYYDVKRVVEEALGRGVGEPDGRPARSASDQADDDDPDA